MRKRDRIFIAALFGFCLGAVFGVFAAMSPGYALLAAFSLAGTVALFLALVFVTSAGRAFE